MKTLFLLSLFIIIFNTPVTAKNESCEWLYAGDVFVTAPMVEGCESDIENLSIDALSKLISWVVVSSDLDAVSAVVYLDLERTLAANKAAPVDFHFLTLKLKNEPLGVFQLFESIGIDIVNSRLGENSIAYYAIETGNIEIFEHLAFSQKYDELVSEDINLLAAVTAGNIDILQMLLRLDLNTQITDKSGCNMLDYAIAHNELVIHEYLVQELGMDKPLCKPVY